MRLCVALVGDKLYNRREANKTRLHDTDKTVFEDAIRQAVGNSEKTDLDASRLDIRHVDGKAGVGQVHQAGRACRKGLVVRLLDDVTIKLTAFGSDNSGRGRG